MIKKCNLFYNRIVTVAFILNIFMYVVCILLYDMQ